MKRFKNILCVVDALDESNPALEFANTLAQSNQADLAVITVAPSIGAATNSGESSGITSELLSATLNNLNQKLKTLVEPYLQRTKIDTKIIMGTPFIEIIREVLRNDYDLVIKCPKSPEWMDRFFSSDDKHLLRKCPCPVLMVKPQTKGTIERILAAVDVHDGYTEEELASRQALNETVMELASSLAISEFSELHVAHAWEAIGESALRHSGFMQRPENEVNAYVDKIQDEQAKLLDNLVRHVSKKLGKEATDYIKFQLHMPKGPARKEIPKLVSDLDANCIVMGTVARTGIPGFFVGNTAETILDQLNCSVLAIKPPGFITPITLENG